MEKRMLIAVGLSIAVLALFSLLFPSRPVAPVPVKAAKTADAPAGQVTEPAALPAAAPAAPVTAPAAIPDVPERLITIETDLYTAVISTRGGVIKSWKLKAYKDDTGAPIEMVVFKSGLMPLTVAPDGMNIASAGTMPYQADVAGDTINVNGEAPLVLVYNAPDGTSITKSMKFKTGTYAVDMKVDVTGFSGYNLYMGESFGSLTTADKKDYGHVGPITFFDGVTKKDEKDDMEKDTVEYSGTTGWTGISDKYFMAAVAPDGPIKAAVNKGTSDWGYVGVTGAPGASFVVYAGPKEFDRLKALGHDLDVAVDFGWFTFIGKPLFVALQYFHGMVANWGWAIIIVTVIIKVLFAPLTHKSQKSMKRMQKLQPLFAELKEKHKGDPQKLNIEMMELYKKHKVNPMGGCLPMLVQMPVFFALYSVLNNAIELRSAPFALWITDMSAKDPYYVLPVLMGASMLLMQKMTPTSMDPMQNRIMMIMPVVLTFMFINLPSGLVLYFVVSNLLSMAQQLYINKYVTD
ncbi:MAG: membrane protein insertase YidC [Nitrospirae bacterium]|nr:membrane protein insertase YidC [Nitrospirota bacterium]